MSTDSPAGTDATPRAGFARGATPVGIVGCGHLGQGIAAALLKNGLPPADLLVSYGGSPHTRQRLEELGLSGRVRSSAEVLADARTVFLTVRPGEVASLGGLPVAADAVVVSCVAGMTLEALERILGRRVCRAMISGPDSIVAGTAVGAVYPPRDRVAALLRGMGVETLPLTSERQLDEVTVGVTLSAALLLESDPERLSEAAADIGRDHPVLAALLPWARKAAPTDLTEAEQTRYIGRMATPGGVTEAVVGALRSGAPLARALRAGLARTEQLARTG